MIPDHVALLVHSVTTCLDRIADTDLVIGDLCDFPGEGTREVYVGTDNQSARLLLIESTEPNGPYGRALSKRGAGLHHICFQVPEVREFISGLSGTGWMVLPQSLKTLEQSNTGWLGRPGVGTLLEVVEGAPPTGNPVVTQLAVGMPSAMAAMLQVLGWSGSSLFDASDSNDNEAQRITFGGHAWAVADLVAA